MQDPTIFAWDMLNEPRCDCFPITIPPPEDDVSCRPDCAVKMQASASVHFCDVRHLRSQAFGQGRRPHAPMAHLL